MKSHIGLKGVEKTTPFRYTNMQPRKLYQGEKEESAVQQVIFCRGLAKIRKITQSGWGEERERILPLFQLQYHGQRCKKTNATSDTREENAERQANIYKQNVEKQYSQCKELFFI